MHFGYLHVQWYTIQESSWWLAYRCVRGSLVVSPAFTFYLCILADFLILINLSATPLASVALPTNGGYIG